MNAGVSIFSALLVPHLLSLFYAVWTFATTPRRGALAMVATGEELARQETQFWMLISGGGMLALAILLLFWVMKKTPDLEAQGPRDKRRRSRETRHINSRFALCFWEEEEIDARFEREARPQ